MTSRLSGVLGIVVLIAAVAGLLTLTGGATGGGNAASSAAGRTAWGDPDLQGIWTDPYQQANRIYYEPRCHEGNDGLPTMLLGTRTEERAFARGRGRTRPQGKT